MSFSIHLERWSRRRVLRGVGGSAVLLAAAPVSACDQLGGARTLARRGARRLAIPPLEAGSIVNGERRFDLSVRNGEKAFGGDLPSPTIGINAPYLGPTLQMRRGEKVRFHVSNRLAEGITMHWHGFELPAATDGGPHQLIRPGENWTPAFDVRQRASFYWYHSHMHRRTGPQVYAGLAGPIYVRDEEEDRLDLPSDYGVDDIPLMVQDRIIGEDGSLVYPTGMHARMMGVTGEHILVNGTLDPVFEARTGLLRLRLLNASNARFYEFFLDDRRPMQVIATDGGLLDRPYRVSSVSLAPGERAQVLVDLSDGAPVRLRATSPANGMGMMNGSGGGMMGGMMNRRNRDRAPFDILEILPAGSASPVTLPRQLAQLAVPDPSLAVRTRRFTLDMGMMGGAMTINGASMDMAVINECVPVGQWEVWEVVNRSMMAHPFHIHNMQFRVMDRNGERPAPQEWGYKDTVVVNPREQVRLLLRFEENTDPDLPYMYHCHILEHEDAGMMGQFVVVRN